MNLLLLESHELHESGSARLSGERARHLRAVLKVAPGQTVRVGLIDGPVGVGRVTEVGSAHVSLQCEFGQTPPRPPVDLLLALPRPKVLRRLWAQIAAIGVGRIMLTNAERVERNYFDSHLLEPRGYRPLLVEGLRQARDTRTPLVTVHRQFRVLVEDELDTLVTDEVRIVAEPSTSTSVAATMARAPAPRVLLAVGPEGGWNAFELELLGLRGFSRVGMGARALRSDTACVALLALVHEALRSVRVSDAALQASRPTGTGRT
jgi:16S rRNA (uracil1498-N3)-methyltransferase